MSIPENFTQPKVERKKAQEKKEQEEMREAAGRVREEWEGQEQKDAAERARVAWELEEQARAAQEQAEKDEERRLSGSLLDIDSHTYYRIGNKTSDDLPLTARGILSLKPQSQANDAKVFTGEILTNFIGNDKIFNFIQEGKITFEPLDLEADTNYRITNRTGVRIHISNYGKKYQSHDKWGDLVIPPFGSRTVSSETLKWYRFVEWQRQDLIRVESEEQASKGPGALTSLLTWIKLLPGLVLVAIVGFGIPLWVVYYFGGGDHLIQAFVKGEMFSSGQQNLALMGLGRLFQVGFICVASILPPLFYYLFGRQHVEKLRQMFFRDVLVLDPHLYTLSEAETKYDTLLSSAYGSSSSSSPFTILLLMFSTAILVAGWTLTIAPYDPMPQTATSLVDFLAIIPSPFTLGFLGIYFFSINMVFRRYVRADLTPKTYANITVRMLITFVLVWSISTLPELSDLSIIENGLLPLAFIIGVFPEDGFRVIRDSARNIIKRISADKKDNDEKYPLTDLEGLNKYDQARLLEEGIENIENLAHHNLVELLAFTRIPTERLVDMFDQAILYLHLGLFDQNEADAQKMDSGRYLLQHLKSYGVRTATDLIKLIESPGAPEISRVIADDFKIARLQTIYTTFSDDEWLSHIKNWRRESSAQSIRANFVDDPNRFYETGLPGIIRKENGLSETAGLSNAGKDQKPEDQDVEPGNMVQSPQPTGG